MIDVCTRKAVRLGVWCLGVALVGACENPELTYVELPNAPGGAQDASVRSSSHGGSSSVGSGRVDSTQTSIVVAPTNADSTSSRQPTRIVEHDAGALFDAGQVTRDIDATASTTRGSASDTRESPTSTDAEVTSTDARGTDASSPSTSPPDAAPPQEPETSIICECPEEVNPCLSALCLAGLTICTFAPRPGADCDDGNPCTLKDSCDATGECRGESKDCSDADGVCVEGVCSTDNGECEARPHAEDTPCDDANGCSVDDVCNGEGVCVGQPKDCSEFDSSCTVGTCDEASGECLSTPANAGGSCDDNDECTQNDACADDGECHGVPVDCSEASGDCSLGVCDPEDGSCKAEPLSGIACDDGDDCTTLDACEQGQCKGQAADDCGDAGWLDLTSGSASVRMSNECADDDFDVRSKVPKGSDCTRSSGDDIVFILDLSGFESSVTVRASTADESTEYDTVLVLMEQQCSEDAIIACADDSDDAGFASWLEVSVEPGVYALVVDSYRGNEAGSFHLEVSVE